MKNSLSKEQEASYHKNGYLFPLQACSSNKLNYYQENLAHLWKALPKGAKAARNPVQNLPWAYELAQSSRILDAIESILGPDIIIWGSIILSKPPDATSFVSWHQDGHYAEFLNGSPSLTCWIAFTESNAENGCMRVLPGSQNQRFEHVEIFDEKNIVRQGQTVLGVTDHLAVDLELDPGQMSFHHIDILHNSNPNFSQKNRTGFIIRYATPKVKQRENQVLTYARGQKDFDHLVLNTSAPSWTIEEGIKKHLEMNKKIDEKEKERRQRLAEN